jgi:hypothetical protein
MIMDCIAVFDHDSDGPLKRLADQLGLTVIQKTVCMQANRKLAVDALLKQPANLYLVHLGSDDAWKYLCDKLLAIPKPRPSAIRFSTSDLPATSLSFREHGWLNCSKKLGTQQGLSKEEFSILVSICANSDSRDGLMKEGLIPPEVRGLFVFAEPNTLRALHILLQGVLAAWASDPGHLKSSEARQILGVSELPYLLAERIDNCSTLRRALGLDEKASVTTDSGQRLRKRLASELGILQLDDCNDINQFLSAILNAKPNDTLNPDVAMKAFEAIEQELQK